MPSISLPKGSGAIHGMGEKFAVSSVTGTGSVTISLPVSPACGLEPSLSLSHDSNSGNGPFGFGWTLSLPSITHKISRGLLRYDDANESDVFVISGMEDLVPQLMPDGSRHRDLNALPGYAVHRYLARIQGPFSRIVRCTSLSVPEDVHQRVTSSNNLLTVYGNSSSSRIFNSETPEQVFTWFVSEIRGQRGYATLYKHKSEDGSGVGLSLPHQCQRGAVDDARRKTSRYLKSVIYGNRTPLLDEVGNRPHFLGQDQAEGAR